jgi:glycosyltransferase involved in cell wall biosynthesis
MRIGIYNRWLKTFGGGEKHSLAIAEYLSQKHSVEVINHQSVEKEIAENRLNLDLSKIEFRTIPECLSSELTPITADYDLFVNASYLDFFPSQAKFSTTLIYFPTKIYDPVSSRGKLKLLARQWFKIPTFASGVNSYQVANSTVQWLTEEVVKIRFAPSASEYQVTFDLRSCDPLITRATLYLDDEQISRINFSDIDSFVHCKFMIPGTQDVLFHELIIKAETNKENGNKNKLELTRMQVGLPNHRFYRQLFERGFQNLAWRLNYFPAHTNIPKYLDTYDMIWANSEFTRKWIKKYWHLKSEVLYPPVNVDDFKMNSKRQQILNVGRFFAGQHNKKHSVLVEAFKEMVDAGLKGWEFHLVGGTTPGEIHEAYLSDIYQSSKGYPIVIHPDATFEELVRLYTESTIYWHASGFGENEKQHPEKFEHFGITTVEAMASGCVPIVISKGGQPEIVKNNENGFLWNTLKELKKRTLQVIEDPTLQNRLSTAALVSSKTYDKNHFQARIDFLLDQIGFPG